LEGISLGLTRLLLSKQRRKAIKRRFGQLGKLTSAELLGKRHYVESESEKKRGGLVKQKAQMRF